MRRLIPLLLLTPLLAGAARSCDDDQDADGDGYTPAGGDCDDESDGVHPGAPEACDGIDNDCDGGIDGGCDDVIAPATDGPLSNPFRVDATGNGTRQVAGLELSGSVGGLTIGGVAHRGVAYQSHDWQGAGYVLYDVLSIAEDGSDLALTYLYCQGQSMPYVYMESFVHAMQWEYASGSCDGQKAPATAEVGLPALTTLPQPFDSGIDIAGPDIELTGPEGWIELNQTVYDLLPFNTVDCSSCPGGPWLELHNLLIADGEACFGILYLFPENPGSVLLSYSLCLPTLTRPAGEGRYFEATWSGTLETRGRTSALAPDGIPFFRPLPRMADQLP